MEMTLIADSGSTKTDWVLMPADSTAPRQTALQTGTTLRTQGINPIHQDDGQIAAILRDELLPLIARQTGGGGGPASITAIRFYGSGVRPDQEERMERLLREAFATHPSLTTDSSTLIEAHSDLLGAARALCGGGEGLACILGTGANSCLYDGRQIVANTPALGYILGDEGSGAVLGIRFLNALYKGSLSSDTRTAFEAEMQTTLAGVIDHVYRQPMANRWLASLSPFIHNRLADPAVEALVVDNFAAFIARNIEPYRRRDLPLNAVGSIAYYYSDQLRQAATKAGYAVGKILRSPLEQPGAC